MNVLNQVKKYMIKFIKKNQINIIQTNKVRNKYKCKIKMIKFQIQKKLTSKIIKFKNDQIKDKLS